LNIILVSGRLAKARTITIGIPHIVAFVAASVLTIVTLAGAINYAMLRYATELNFVPHLQKLVTTTQDRQGHDESYLRDNLNAMAVKLGQMQAQLLRLDTLGERLVKLVGFKPQDFLFTEPPGRGGADSSTPNHEISLNEMSRSIDDLVKQLDDRGDKLGVLDSLLTLDGAKKKLLPSMLPLEGGSYASNYGWRLDPFNGRHAFHEGIDFTGAYGTPILAAAGGVVIYSDYHPQYGNMVEIDHGNDLVTRYAHASKLLVKVGDLVQRSVRIAEVGSTGRATGTHLHFEVRAKGVAQNPSQFLRLPG
jgi:murein DD-endopeptidase MepM/ murein hydrolase activator NlpD